MEDLPISTVVAAWGFAAGLVFGGTAQKTNFCTMGAISDAVFMGDYNRFRAWMLAIAVALIGSQAMHMAEIIDLGEAIYLTTNFAWLGAIIGGLMFGFGMTMAGGCGNKTLVRIGGGNLKSLVVAMVMGIFAYMTLRGLIGLWRVEIESATNLDLSQSGLQSQGIVDMIAALFGAEVESLRGIVVAVVAIGFLIYCFKSAEFRKSGTNIAAGVIIGALIPAGWYITGVIGYDDFEPTPLFSFTFVSPTAESIQYLMTFTGSTINFGIGTIGGVIVGSFLVALATRSFHMEAFTDGNDMLRHLIGGALMGVGGIAALGCTIGQGITGMSTLAAGSVLALLSILAGGYLGMKYLEEGSLGGALKAALARG
jgi:uncharacterized membrane protein YedE/YeeE